MKEIEKIKDSTKKIPSWTTWLIIAVLVVFCGMIFAVSENKAQIGNIIFGIVIAFAVVGFAIISHRKKTLENSKGEIVSPVSRPKSVVPVSQRNNAGTSIVEDCVISQLSPDGSVLRKIPVTRIPDSGAWIVYEEKSKRSNDICLADGPDVDTVSSYAYFINKTTTGTYIRYADDIHKNETNSYFRKTSDGKITPVNAMYVYNREQRVSEIIPEAGVYLENGICIRLGRQWLQFTLPEQSLINNDIPPEAVFSGNANVAKPAQAEKPREEQAPVNDIPPIFSSFGNKISQSEPNQHSQSAGNGGRGPLTR